MRKPFAHRFKTGLLLTAGALFVVGHGAFAQTSNETGELMSRLNQLDNQIQTLSRAVFKGDKSAAAAAAAAATSAPANSASIAAFDSRLSQLEDQQKALTGQIEKANYNIQQMKDRLDRMQADTEQRFQQQAASKPAPAPQSTIEQTPPPSTQTLGELHSSEGNSGPAEAMYEKAFANIRDAKYDDAEDGFRQFLSQYPGHPLASNATYWLGETYYVRGNFKEAAKTFAQSYQNFPKGAKAQDSLLKLGLSLSKLGKKDDACISLRQLQKEHGVSPALQLRAEQEIKQLDCQ